MLGLNYILQPLKLNRGEVVQCCMINEAVGILAINCILKIKSAFQYKF